MKTLTDAEVRVPIPRRTGDGPPRILVTGSRDWRDRGRVAMALLQAWNDLGKPEPCVLVSGACPTGADRMAEDMWENYGWPIERHPADWEKHGKAAGPIRNQEMVDLNADICLAFPLPNSRGTTHCMAAAALAGIPVRIVEPRP